MNIYTVYGNANLALAYKQTKTSEISTILGAINLFNTVVARHIYFSDSFWQNGKDQCVLLVWRWRNMDGYDDESAPERR